MPAGLDGNPNPVSSEARRAVLAEVAAEALARRDRGRPLLIAVDGRSGSGKSTFADELTTVLLADALSAVRSTTDSFHNDRETRYRLGARSPEGYYRDSFNLSRLRHELLDPVRRGDGQYRLAVLDEPTNAPVNLDYLEAHASMVLVFDGLFLHRPELRGYWDLSVLLLSDERSLTDSAAWAVRENGSNGPAMFLWLIWWWSIARRYVEGWKVYESECDPGNGATFVVDNNDFTAPSILKRPQPRRGA